MTRHLRVALLGWAFALTAIACGSAASTPSDPSPTTTTTPTPTPTLSADLVFIADAGFRKESASNPAAGVDASGTVYLYYEDRATHQQLVATSADGLTFGGGTPINPGSRANDSRRTLLPDGRWRLYQWDSRALVMTSSVSADGISFTPEAGIRYAPVAADNGMIGVYEAFTEGSQVVLLYLGDLQGLNNLRRAVSTDNGTTFTFDRGNVLGDSALGGGSNSYVDPKTIKLPDGRRRLIVMKGGTEIDSFISSDGAQTFTLESGTRLKLADFSVPPRSLNDPVVVRLPDGRYRMYVAALVTATNEFSIASATTRLGTSVNAPLSWSSPAQPGFSAPQVGTPLPAGVPAPGSMPPGMQTPPQRPDRYQ